jgi:hypothetical protein
MLTGPLFSYGKGTWKLFVCVEPFGPHKIPPMHAEVSKTHKPATGMILTCLIGARWLKSKSFPREHKSTVMVLQEVYYTPDWSLSHSI